MRRIRLFVVGALVLGALVPAVALAASSPTVETGAAAHVTTGSAVLTGTINPNGASTGYSFNYGASSALGTTTGSQRAGHGDKVVAVKQSITGLIPGTTYYYQLGALSTKGGTAGQVRTFKTAGPPPPGAVTGAASAVGSTTATVTGTIDTNGAATSWNVQYGTTTGYGVNTTAQIVANSATPVPVSASLSGLAPLTLFHYRIVAFHSGTSIGAGADGAFFTKPAKPLAPNLRTKTTPKRDKKSPYAFTTFGTLRGNAVVPPTLRCVGNTTVNYYRGKTRTAHVVAPVQPNCTFAAHVSFRRSHGKGVVPITVRIHYLGNGYLAGVKKVGHVKIGHK
jgi:phosphodiesterase/alkaline phosphatase D-like protein